MGIAVIAIVVAVIAFVSTSSLSTKLGLVRNSVAELRLKIAKLELALNKWEEGK